MKYTVKSIESYNYHIFYLFFVGVVLGIEHRALCILGKCSTSIIEWYPYHPVTKVFHSEIIAYYWQTKI
jgi:hypothetical protein